MSYYISREVAFGEGETLSVADCTLSFNYLREFEITVTETQSVEPVIGGERDDARVALLQEETEIRCAFDVMSFKPFHYALGRITSSTVPPYFTITPDTILPWLTFSRELLPAETLQTTRLTGCKVSTAEFTFERGEVVTAEFTLFAKKSTLETTAVSVTIDYTKDPIWQGDYTVYLNNEALKEVGRLVISIDNNLARRISASKTAGYTAYHILEGALTVEGRLMVGEQALTLMEKVLDRTGGNTLEIRVDKTHGGIFSGTISMPNVWFVEYPERIRGIEPYEVEITFRAFPTATEPAIKAVCNTIWL